jgi:membrane protein implicated in regulation of membrane protease activity
LNWIDWMWLILTLVCVILEILTYGIFFILFALGTLAAFILSRFTDHAPVQVGIFALVTVLALIFLRPAVRRWLHLGKYGQSYGVPDYISQNVGKEGIVIKAIPAHGKGQIKVGTEVWTANAQDFGELPEGARVRIIRIQGVTAIVEMVPNHLS